MDKWVITLAFPFEEQLNKAGNKIASSIYAFLSTEMITGEHHFFTISGTKEYLTAFHQLLFLPLLLFCAVCNQLLQCLEPISLSTRQLIFPLVWS